MPSQFSTARELFVVDDDAGTRDALSVVFTLAGYRVSVFADAGTFLAPPRAPSSPPPCCSICICRTSPGSTCSRNSTRSIIRRRSSSSRATATSACAVEAVKSGAFDYMLKPFDARAIVMRVGNAIAGFATRNHPAGDGYGFEFPGRGRLTAARARGAGADRRRRLEQGGRTPPRHQPAHRRGTSRPASWKRSAPATPPIWCESCSAAATPTGLRRPPRWRPWLEDHSVRPRESGAPGFPHRIPACAGMSG